MNPAPQAEGSDHERRLAEALASYVDLESSQTSVDIDRFCSQFGELAAELRQQIAALNEIEGTTAPEDPVMPEVLSGYRILGGVGSGGMGRVLLALDEGLGRKVAIKTLSPRLASDPVLRSRFMNEARAMAALTHPNIVRIYKLGPPDEIAHFVMEYVDGEPLTTAARALGFREKAELMRKVLLAVEFLHQNHLVHRDLKPGNILVDRDREPRLLDFGLVLELEPRAEHLTLAGEVMGTPDYFSPEQAKATSTLDARSDIFSLGAIFYEVLTGSLPFSAPGLEDQVREICERDPVLPRRIDRSVPAELQNICIKALEKVPAERYGSAREMAADIERYLQGETVLAAPPSYGRVMRARVEQHLRDLEGWMHDRLITDSEFDAFRRHYDRLIEREDAWILEARRLTLSQVTLYFGAWLLIVGAALIVLFQYPRLHGPGAIAVVAAVASATVWTGIRLWDGGRYRIAIAYLLAFCLLLPVAVLVTMGESGLLTGFTRGREDLELFSKWLPSFRHTTNAQLWMAMVLSLPAYYGLRRFTGASVFSLVFSVMGALLCLVTLLRMGLLEWIDRDPGRFYYSLLPCAVLFFAVAWWLEHLRQPEDSRYFYPLVVVFTLAAFSGLATFHEPWAAWLKRTFPWTRGGIEYLFLINAGVYYALQVTLGRWASAQIRAVAKAFRFMLPGHVMGSLLFLGLSASDRWNNAPKDLSLRTEARLFEILLPLLACAFVFGSVPKQMKNFFLSGLFFLAVGIVRLQQDLLRDHALWPIALLFAGLLLMLGSSGHFRRRRRLS